MNNNVTNTPTTPIDQTNYITDQKSQTTSTKKSGISKEFAKMWEGLTQVLPKSITTLRYISEDYKSGGVIDAGLDLFVGSLLFPATFVGSLGGVLISTTYRLIKLPFASDKNKTDTTEKVEEKKKDTKNQIKNEMDDLIESEKEDFNIILEKKPTEKKPLPTIPKKKDIEISKTVEEKKNDTNNQIKDDKGDLNITSKEKTTEDSESLSNPPKNGNIENKQTENKNVINNNEENLTEIKNDNVISENSIKNKVSINEDTLKEAKVRHEEGRGSSALLSKETTSNAWLSNIEIRPIYQYIQKNHDELLLPNSVFGDNFKTLTFGACGLDALGALIEGDIKEAEEKGKQYIAYPLLISANHWALVIVDTKSKEMNLFNSLNSTKKQRSIMSEIANKSNLTFKNKTPGSIQEDTYQCGVWTCYFLKEFLKDPKIDFTQDTKKHKDVVNGEYRDNLNIEVNYMEIDANKRRRQNAQEKKLRIKE